MTKRFNSKKLILALIAAAAIGIGSYAIAAANTVPASNAGIGSGTVSGYTVTNIAYTLGATPSDIDLVEFDISPSSPTPTVKARFVTGGTWYDCTVAGAAVDCDTTSPQLTVLPTDVVEVVAAQ